MSANGSNPESRIGSMSAPPFRHRATRDAATAVVGQVGAERLDELVRRIAGRTLGEYWRTEFAEPLALDFWIGVPEDSVEKVAPIFPPKIAPPKDRFYTAFVTPGSLTLRAFGSPTGLKAVAEMNAPSFPRKYHGGTAWILLSHFRMRRGRSSEVERSSHSSQVIEQMAAPKIKSLPSGLLATSETKATPCRAMRR